MNINNVRSIYDLSQTYPLPDDIKKRITDSTLDLRALKFLGALLEEIKPKYCMEFGSGLSTLFMARLLKVYPSVQIFTVDHSSYYLEQTRNLCCDYGNVKYFYAPISQYQFKFKSFLTYKNDYVINISPEVKFDIVLIDGPLGFQYGREAPLYQILTKVKPETIILLDDAGREPEQQAMASWKRIWREKLTIEYFPGQKGLAVIQIHDYSVIEDFSFGISEIWQCWQTTQSKIKAEGGKISPVYSITSFISSMWNRVIKKFRNNFTGTKKI